MKRPTWLSPRSPRLAHPCHSHADMGLFRRGNTHVRIEHHDPVTRVVTVSKDVWFCAECWAGLPE